MFVYEKKLQYPVNIKQTNPKLAKIIITQYGGPDGELGASLRYLSQRFSMPIPELKGTLTDIGTGVSKMLPFKLGASVFESVKCHFPGKIDKYTSTLFLSKTTILSSICL